MEAKSKNITVAVTPTTYTRARVWAAERNVSLSAVVQLFLTDLPQLRSARNFSKADLPRKVRKPRRATLSIRIERPADDIGALISAALEIPQPCVPVAASPANPSPAPDALHRISS